MRKLCLAAAALVLLAAPALAFDARDRTFDVGRVGAITKNVKPADLAKIYGAGNVKYEKIGYEGGESPGANIFQGTPDYLQVVFDDDATRIDHIFIGGRNWVNKAGLRRGMTMAQLERLSGRPLMIQGFGADEAGRVNSGGPALGPFIIYLALDRRAPEVLRTDGEFSSRHPAFKTLRPTVSFIKVYFVRDPD